MPDSQNRDIYERPGIVSHYLRYEGLQPPETILFVRYRDAIAGRRVLDVGCGAGRTTFFLREFTTHYTGVDYARNMVEACRRRFPDLQFETCDARDMGRFADGSFEFVLFSFNGLDCVDHEGRLCALAETRRALTPGGLFMFSSHNRGFAGTMAGPRLRLSPNPLTQARLLKHYLAMVSRRRRNRRLEVLADEYAIINDEAHNYSLLLYYIAKERQARQLEAAGFELLEMRDMRGQRLELGDPDEHTSSIYYVARRTG
jgi:SAM-dependent methyltransferase